ncbi:MAG: YHS domain-containing protein, partial [Candidatus Binataceae bacterium]
MTDPVCGMKVDPVTAGHSHVHDGVTYYFCCDGCRAKFAAMPAKSLAAAATNAPAIDAGAARPAEQATP